MRFNPEMNDQLRMRLLSMKTSFTPLREEKFTKLILNFVANKEKLLENDMLKEIREDEDSYEQEEEEYGMFNEEKDFVKKFLKLQ
jgi:hypothetical protein